MPSKKNNKNKFKLYSRLRSLSKPDDNDDHWFLNQWHLVKSVRREDGHKCNGSPFSTHTYYEDDGFTCEHVSCLCGHNPIYNLRYIENNQTDNRCIVGTCCIKRFFTDQHKVEMKVMDGEVKGYRYCIECKVKLRDGWPADNPLHDSCRRRNRFKYGKYVPKADSSDDDSDSDDNSNSIVTVNYLSEESDSDDDGRSCKGCGFPLPSSVPSKYTYHYSCWKKMQQNRDCKKCGKLLPSYYPTFKKFHDECYNKIYNQDIEFLDD